MTLQDQALGFSFPFRKGAPPISTGAGRAQLFNVLLAICVGLYLFFDGSYVLQGLAMSTLIKIGVLALLFVLAWGDGGKLGRPALAVLTIYGLLSLESFVVVPFSDNIQSSFFGGVKFLGRAFITFWLLSKAFASPVTNLKLIVNLWVALAIFFAVGSLSIWILGHWLHVDLPSVTINLPRIGTSISFFLGIEAFQGEPRIQSLFSESNKFAQFLLFPLFAVLALRSTPLKWLLFAILLSAFVATFSAAVSMGVLLSAILWVVLRVRTKLLRPILLVSGLTLLAGSITYVQQNLWENATVGPNTIYVEAWSVKQGSIEDTLDQLNLALDLAASHPFGIGMIDREASEAFNFGSDDRNTASGFAQVLGRNGWPGILLYGLMAIIVWRTLIWYAAGVRRDEADPRGLAAGVAFFGLMVAASNFGPYHQATLVVLLSLFLGYAHRYRTTIQSSGMG